MQRVLDGLDYQILLELQADGRLSYNELGRHVHLTAPAVAERVRRLEESGVITGYHARVNPESVGFPVMALVRMGCTGTICVRRGLRPQEFPEVRELHRVSGDDCSILKVVAASMNHLERLLDRLAVFGRPSTVLVLSTPLDVAVLDAQALQQTADFPV